MSPFLRFFGFLLLCAAVIPPPLQSATSGQIEELYAKGLQELQSGQLDSAFETLSKVARMAPQSPQPYFYLGEIELERHSPGAAAEMFLKAIKLKPDYAEAHHALGIAYLQQQRYDQAEQALRAAARWAPNNPLVRLDLGNAYMNERKAPEAIRQFEQLIALAPGNEKLLFAAHFNLGVVLQQSGQLERAVRHFEVAHKLIPTNDEALVRLCKLYFETGRNREADLTIQTLMSRAPRDPSVLSQLTEMLAKHNRWAQLVELLEEQRKSHPSSVPLLQVLSTAYSAQGKNAEAAKALAEALETKQGSAQDYFTLGKLYAAQNDPRSIEAFKKCVTLQPDWDEAWGVLLQELGKRQERIPEAIKIFENYVNLFPDKVFPRLLLGEVYFNVGNLEQAIGQLRKALELDPGSAQALNALGSAYKKMGSPQEARSYFEQAIGADPKNVPARIEMGEILSLEGKQTEAIGVLKKAIELNPAFPEAYLQLGKTYLAQKQYSHAQEVLEKAVRLNPEQPQSHFFLAKAYFGLQDSKAAQAEYDRFRELQKPEPERAPGGRPE